MLLQLLQQRVGRPAPVHLAAGEHDYVLGHSLQHGQTAEMAVTVTVKGQCNVGVLQCQGC